MSLLEASDDQGIIEGEAGKLQARRQVTPRSHVLSGAGLGWGKESSYPLWEILHTVLAIRLYIVPSHTAKS